MPVSNQTQQGQVHDDPFVAKVGCAVIAIILWLVVDAVTCDCKSDKHAGSQPERSSSYSEGNDKIGAWVAAQYFVKQDLKNPRGAKFEFAASEKRGAVKYVGNNTYSVNSYVDATNSFGATVRTRFYLRVHDDGGGDWSLVGGITYDDGSSWNINEDSDSMW